MLFSSYEFILLFLPLSFFIYFYLNKKRLINASKSWLVFVSLFFYSYWNIIYLPLILGSLLFNYNIANILSEYDENKKNYFSKKLFLQIGLIVNSISESCSLEKSSCLSNRASSEILASYFSLIF